MKNNITRKITFIALMSAMIAVLSQIAIPLPSGVPITLQTFAVAFAGYIMGYKYGPASVAVYILLGAVGVPVFSGFKGGAGVLMSVTGGFILGFLPMTFLCGIFAKRKAVFAIICGISGLIVCHLFGIIQYALIGEIPFEASFLSVSAPYLIKDVISIVAAYYVYKLINRRKAFVI